MLSHVIWALLWGIVMHNWINMIIFDQHLEGARACCTPALIRHCHSSFSFVVTRAFTQDDRYARQWFTVSPFYSGITGFHRTYQWCHKKYVGMYHTPPSLACLYSLMYSIKLVKTCFVGLFLCSMGRRKMEKIQLLQACLRGKSSTFWKINVTASEE